MDPNSSYEGKTGDWQNILAHHKGGKWDLQTIVGVCYVFENRRFYEKVFK